MGRDWCRLWWRGRVEREGVEGGGVAGPLTQHISLGIEETELVPVLCRRADCVRNAEFTIVDDSDSEIVFLSPGRQIAPDSVSREMGFARLHGKPVC